MMHGRGAMTCILPDVAHPLVTVRSHDRIQAGRAARSSVGSSSQRPRNSSAGTSRPQRRRRRPIS
eukprot:8045462-Pyramimonas_sp.AAC.1